MGGSGSGRYYHWGGSKSTVESTNAISVNWLKEQGYFESARRGGVSWTRGGRPAGDIQVLSDPPHTMVFTYRSRSGDGPWENVEERVAISWTDCNYGGQRPWFICPGVVNGRTCARRVDKLYSGGKYFLCRHCYGLTYHSTREGFQSRMFNKARAIRQKLGGNAGLAEQFPSKPKGMHWTTYDKLFEASYSFERRGLGAMEPNVLSLLRGLDRRKTKR